MGKSDRIPPPGPNPREDQMTEKDQRQLRRHMLGREESEPGRTGEGEEERQMTDKETGKGDKKRD